MSDVKNIGLAEIIFAAEANATYLERMADEFGDTETGRLFSHWSAMQTRLVKEAQQFLKDGFEPTVATHNEIWEWYQNHCSQRPNPLSDSMLTDDEAKDVKDIGIF